LSKTSKFFFDYRFYSNLANLKVLYDSENINWESYARGAVYALQNSGYDLRKGIIGYISGVKGLDSSGLSSSAAVGISYLLALENVNDLVVSSVDNIQLDKSIENKYLGLENGILDPSAILLSRYVISPSWIARPLHLPTSTSQS